MNTLQALVLTYLVNSLWQVPLIYAAAWLAVRISARSGPATEHRIWVAALLAEAVLPACPTPSRAAIAPLLHLFHLDLLSGAPRVDARITILAGPGLAPSASHLSPHLLTAIVVAYLLATAYFAARLLWSLARTGSMQRNAAPFQLTGTAANTWARCCHRFHLRNASVATSPQIASPVTIGMRRRLLLLPAVLPPNLLAEDLNAALAHECAHMHRYDFAKNLAYAALALPIAWHPILWLTRARLEETREMVCDSLAAEALNGSERFANSLLRLAAIFAQRPPDKTLRAIGIFDANIFERRVMNLTLKPTQPHIARRLTTIAACAVIACTACASALALRMNVSTQSRTVASRSVSAGAEHATPSEPVLISSKPPEFPQNMLTKKGKVDDTVIVALIVSKAGIPSMVVVNKKGSNTDFDQSAVEAVKQYRFKPALLDGKPVEYPMKIYVNFKRF